jgi:hypothetical protein
MRAKLPTLVSGGTPSEEMDGEFNGAQDNANGASINPETNHA